ncbi:MAG: DUF1588 domain-containing protein [Myxococcales bacterium]
MVRLRCELVLVLGWAVGCGGGISQRTVSEAAADAGSAGEAQAGGAQQVGGTSSVAMGGYGSAGTPAGVGMAAASFGGHSPQSAGAPGVAGCGPSPNLTPLQPLSSWEYGQSVLALTNAGVTAVLSDDAKPLGPFAYSMDLSAAKVQQLFSEAERQGTLARDGKLLPCSVNEPVDGKCAQAFVDSFVGRVFRRPLSDAESSRYVNLFKTGSGSGDMASGVELVVEAALMSPLFLHKIYLGAQTTPGALQPLTPFEVAARVSFLFTGALPDAALWEAAVDGDLLSDKGIETSARRLLASPVFPGAVQHFHEQWLGLDELPRFVSAQLPEAQMAEMRDETETFVQAVFAAKRRLPDLLHSSADPMRPAGLLTEPSTLVRFNNPTQRGRFVRERLLCDVVPPPPPQIPKTIEVAADQTRRQAWEQHVTDPSCASCHRLMDPIGFGFENFDAQGRYRVTDNGLPVDASGEIADSDGSSEAFVGTAQLATLLGDSPKVGKCLARTWLGYGLQRVTDTADDCVVDSVYDRFASADLDIGELLVAIVKTPRFRSRDPYPVPTVPTVPEPTFTPGPIEPLSARRKLVLELAVAEARWLQALVPAEGKEVVDHYLSSLRDLEIQLTQIQPPAGGQ